VILDVGEFVGNDARHSSPREHVQEPGCRCDGGMIRIAPGRERRSAAGCP